MFPRAGSRSLLLRQGFPPLSDPSRSPVTKGNALKMEVFSRAYMHCTILMADHTAMSLVTVRQKIYHGKHPSKRHRPMKDGKILY